MVENSEFYLKKTTLQRLTVEFTTTNQIVHQKLEASLELHAPYWGGKTLLNPLRICYTQAQWVYLHPL